MNTDGINKGPTQTKFRKYRRHWCSVRHYNVTGFLVGFCQLDTNVYISGKWEFLIEKKMFPSNWPVGKTVEAFFKVMIKVGGPS